MSPLKLNRVNSQLKRNKLLEKWSENIKKSYHHLPSDIHGYLCMSVAAPPNWPAEG